MRKMKPRPGEGEKRKEASAVALQELFRGKWRIQVLECLCASPRRLSELQRILPECTKKMLLDTLHSLLRLGWITRLDRSGKLKWVEYAIEPSQAAKIRLALNRATDT
jgi:DNA-binding HxlR family transcriptional regulator